MRILLFSLLVIVNVIFIGNASVVTAQTLQEQCDNALPGLKPAFCDSINADDDDAVTTPGSAQDDDAVTTPGSAQDDDVVTTPGTANPESIEFESPLKGITTIEGLLQTLIQILIVLATPLIVVFIILAGFKYVTAQGDPTKIEEAKRALVYAIIGGVLIIGASAIAQIIANTITAFQ